MLSFATDMGLMALHYIFTTVLPKCFVYFCGWKGLFRAPLALVYGFHLFTMGEYLYSLHVISILAFLISYCVDSPEDAKSSDANDFDEVGSHYTNENDENEVGSTHIDESDESEVGSTGVDEIDESNVGISDTDETDECEETDFVNVGLYVLFAIVILRLAANVGRTLIQYKLLKVFACGFVGYQYFKWLPTLRNLAWEMDDYTIESYLEYYFGVSTSSIDLLEGLESSDANEYHGMGTKIETNENDGSELGSSDTNEIDERIVGLSECDAVESDAIEVRSNDKDESGTIEVDESDENEVESSDESGTIEVDERDENEVESSDEGGEIEVRSNDKDESSESEVESNDINQRDEYVVVPLLHGRFGAK